MNPMKAGTSVVILATNLVLLCHLAESFTLPMSACRTTKLFATNDPFSTLMSAGVDLPKIEAPDLKIDEDALNAAKENLANIKIGTEAFKDNLANIKIDKDALNSYKDQLANIDKTQVTDAYEKLKKATQEMEIKSMQPTDFMSQEALTNAQDKLGILKSNWESQTAGLKNLKGMNKGEAASGLKDFASKLGPSQDSEVAQKLNIMKENWAKMGSGGKPDLKLGGDLEEKLNIMKGNLNKENMGGGIGDVVDKIKDTASDVQSAATSDSGAVSSVKSAFTNMADSVTGSFVANAADDSMIANVDHHHVSSQLHHHSFTLASVMADERAPLLMLGVAALVAVTMMVTQEKPDMKSE